MNLFPVDYVPLSYISYHEVKLIIHDVTPNADADVNFTLTFAIVPRTNLSGQISWPSLCYNSHCKSQERNMFRYISGMAALAYQCGCSDINILPNTNTTNPDYKVDGDFITITCRKLFAGFRARTAVPSDICQASAPASLPSRGHESPQILNLAEFFDIYGYLTSFSANVNFKLYHKDNEDHEITVVSRANRQALNNLVVVFETIDDLEITFEYTQKIEPFDYPPTTFTEIETNSFAKNTETLMQQQLSDYLAK
jgi:hypothetical protein